MSDAHDTEGLLFDFVSQYQRDRAAGEARDLAHYLTRFPARDEQIAREFLRLREQDACASDDQRAADAARAVGADSDGSRAAEHGAADSRGARDSMPVRASGARNDEVDAGIALDDMDAVWKRLIEQGPRPGRYGEAREIARGGMGAIHEIWDAHLWRRLAKKVLLGTSRRRQATFIEEAQITSQLDHPGIVPVHELGLDEHGRLYFTMKLVKGSDLKQVFDWVRTGENGWTLHRALGVLLKVCDAMAYAHSKGVIHRDLKPSNVMVGSFGQVYVMDWGLSRALGRADRHDVRVRAETTAATRSIRTGRKLERASQPDSPILTLNGDVIGTPAYMPPEQAQGRLADIGPHSDVYAVGAMLYHLLAGHAPYLGPTVAANDYAVWRWVQEGPPAPLDEHGEATPAEIVSICKRAMQRDQTLRYRDMSELAADLSAYLEGRVVRSHERGAWAEARKWLRRNRALATALSLGVLAILTGAFASSVQAREATRARDELSVANVALQRSNAELGAAHMRANANAEEALRKSALAEQHLGELLSLTAQDELDELVARAERLWPARPSLVPAYETWLEEARALTEGRPASATAPARPGLVRHRARLAQLRARARAATPAELESARRDMPLVAELELRRATLLWHARMLGLQAWPAEAEIRSRLLEAGVSDDVRECDDRIWNLVDPDQPVDGGETEALVLATLVLPRVPPNQRASLFEGMAWALFRVGRFSEARERAELALSAATDAQRRLAELVCDDIAAAIARWDTEQARAERRADHDRLALEVQQLEARVDTATSSVFDDTDTRWWHARLSKLVGDLESLVDARRGLCGDTIDEAFSWGIAKRLAYAREIDERSVSGADARERWEHARAAIASSPAYRGLELQPQIGLLPLGADPASGLWEFAHLASGAAPQRADDGILAIDADSAIVLVLVPGGRARIGAQSKDAEEASYDALALPNEKPQTLSLDPYFLSKFELTYAQWLRMGGHDDSAKAKRAYKRRWNRTLSTWTPLHPVDMVSWTECERLLRRMDLLLPTEAQWEWACRAGTSTPYWCGADPAALRDAGNVADQFWAAKWREPDARREAWDDGQYLDAEIGSYRANPYGLYDMHGNVWEWCRDWYGVGSKFGRGDGERDAIQRSHRAIRGGGFDQRASYARSSYRHFNTPDSRYDGTGVRPSRKLDG